MPIQKTFTLIPQLPRARDSPDRGLGGRPMTSKQVQKAYKAANRGPRMSRAEIRKQERAEQERIRREFEKEKAAAKAKAVREKKKEKEAKEREEKKRKGLPLVDVRPSQDTISRFFRGNGLVKKRNSEGGELKMVEEEPEPVGEMSLPRITSPPPVNLEDTNVILGDKDTTDMVILDDSAIAGVTAGMDQSPESAPEAALAGLIEIPTSPAPPRSWVQDLEGFGESFEEDFDFKVEKEDQEALDHEATEVNVPKAIEIHSLSQPRPKEIDVGELAGEFDEDIETEMLQGLEAMLEEPGAEPPNPPNPPMAKPTSRSPPKSSRPRTRYEEDLGLQIPTEEELSQWRASARSSHHCPPPSPPRRIHAPPLSTQAILCNFDDFFPSPSQQARELEEERLSQPSPIPRRSPPAPPPPAPESVHPDSPSPPPQRRFFTPSGSHELMALALQRSRRTAALEELHQRERMKLEAGMIAQAEAEEKARRERALAKKNRAPANPSVKERDAAKRRAPERPTDGSPVTEAATTPAKTTTPSKTLVSKRTQETPQRPCKRPKITDDVPRPLQRQKMPEVAPEHNKENLDPPTSPGPSASQETEYGGDWIDGIDVELII